MKALQLNAPGGLSNVRLVDREPTRCPGLVTVAMHTVGLCRTDLLVAQGKLEVPEGLVLGHEGSGVVLDAASGWFAPGQRVAINPCLANGQFLGLHADGLLQERVQLPEDQLFLAEGLPFHVAAYLEPVAASMAVAKALGTPGERGLLLGDNRIAHLTYLILRSFGYSVEWVQETVYEGPANKYGYAIETQFEGSVISSLIKALRPGGTLVVKSRQFLPTEIVPRLLVEKEITMRAVNYGNFNMAMAWLSEHQNTVAPLMGERFALERWEDAFEAASRPAAAKIFIEL